ncbi:class I SAM-dependent rRNA methyltransferase [Thermaurantiacus sp.]
MSFEALVAEPTPDHALLDSGHGRKLERCGPFRVIRPEPQALWAPAAPAWAADATFTGGADEEGGGRWTLSPTLPARWPIEQAGVALWAMPTPFRHLGFFPEMAPHWARLSALPPGARLLNLFGYTGVASLVAARAGLEVVHVDASRKAIGYARANAALSGLEAAPIRWIVDDARAFAARERRRGRTYQAILLDPPKHGRGPKGETFDLFTDLAPLLGDCIALLARDARLLILTCYAVRLAPSALGTLLAAAAPRAGTVSWGEMGLREVARGLVLPTAIFARWEAC